MALYVTMSVCCDKLMLPMQIGSLSVGPEADAQFVQLYVIFMNQLVTVLPVTADIPKAYEQGSDDEQEFVQNLAIFLTGFLKVRASHMHNVSLRSAGHVVLPIYTIYIHMCIQICRHTVQPP